MGGDEQLDVDRRDESGEIIKNNLPKGLASLFNIQQQQTCCLFFQAEADTNDKEILKNIHCVKS